MILTKNSEIGLIEWQKILIEGMDELKAVIGDL